MARRPVEVSLYATPERVKKAREMVIEPRETGTAGNVIMTGQRELQECALDVLYRNGRLGSGDDARWRYNAGFWLRELYLKTHPTDGVGAYSLRLEGLGGFVDIPVSEAEANDDGENSANWNFKCLQDTIKAMGRHWRILEQVCCEDHALASMKIWEALDALRDLREGYLSDYLASFEKIFEESKK